MIKNDWQLRVTQKQIKNFEDALFELKRLPESEIQPWLRAAQRESLESELKNLRKQVDEYKLLQTGQVSLPGLEAIQQVPELLIKTRISKGLNQEALAARLGVSKQCIQQYEQSNYAHVTLSMVQKIIDALVDDRAAGPITTSSQASSKNRSSRSATEKTVTTKKTAPVKNGAPRNKGISRA